MASAGGKIQVAFMAFSCRMAVRWLQHRTWGNPVNERRSQGSAFIPNFTASTRTPASQVSCQAAWKITLQAFTG